jgi:hypothetical protein
MITVCHSQQSILCNKTQHVLSSSFNLITLVKLNIINNNNIQEHNQNCENKDDDNINKKSNCKEQCMWKILTAVPVLYSKKQPVP